MKRVILFMVVLVISCYVTGCKSNDYEKAVELLESGKYMQALKILEELEANGGYEDSSNKVKECQYLQAKQYFEEQNYMQSYELYCDLLGYKDSEERMIEAEYALANFYAANENYGKAYCYLLR